MELPENFFAVSIRGASHIKSDKPMQDYSLARKGTNCCIGVVCDGHGADKHFRSEIGSRIAAKSTMDKLTAFVEANPDWKTAENNLSAKIERLKLAILSEWQFRIEDYTENNPFTEEELKKVSSSFTARCKFDIGSPYGTTVLAALVASDYYLVMMLGDGAIAKIMPDLSAEIVKFPEKPTYDDQPHARTDSLCESDSFSKMFVVCEPNEPNIGVAFAMCSDGLSEAFLTDEILLARLKNYLNYYAEEGLEKATAAIEAQLNEISRLSAMKDDISVAFATNALELYDKSKAAAETNTAKGTEEGAE